MNAEGAAVFSFFSGAGFLDLGFENSGFSIKYVNEYHQPFLDAYKHSRSILGISNPEFGYDPRSIEDVTTGDIDPWIAEVRKSGVPVGFIGGPPCPDFSIGGKNRGHSGEHGRLSKVYVDLICDSQPDFFLFENVKGLYRTKKHREFFDSLKVKLIASGYQLHERLINSIEYGAPQDRDRIILLGFNESFESGDFEWAGRKYPDRSAFDYPWPNTSPFRSDKFNAAPNDIPIELTVEAWFQRNRVDDHPNSRHCFRPRAGLARFETVDEGDDAKKSYKRLHRWRYSPTAAYGNNEVHLHPYLPRRLTVAEALAIQSLPQEFELPATMSLSNMFKTVGNGVPYLAALGLAGSIAAHIEKKYASNSRESCKSNQRPAA